MSTSDSGKIRVGNAPVSFGIFEPGFGETRQMPWAQVLDHIAGAGYEGTELGPFGYLPTDPEVLAQELGQRHLALASSFVPVALADASALDAARQEVLTVGRLLASQGVSEVIVADAGDEKRRAEAGRGAAGWEEEQWAQAARTLDALGRALRQELGMSVVVHHHAGTYLETPGEIELLLEVTDPERVNLLLDTGHYVYGGGDPAELLQRHGPRITYVHYKDVDAGVLERIRKEKLHMQTAWRQGVFVPLGQGCVDFAALTESLRQRGYAGWIIVEQDVVPDEKGQISPDPLQCARASREHLAGLGL